MTLSRRDLFLICASSSIVLILNMFLWQSKLIGLVVGYTYGLTLAIHVGRMFGRMLDQLERVFWGNVVAFFTIAILATLVYYIYAITPVTAAVLALLPLLSFFIPEQTEDLYLANIQEKQLISVLTLIVFFLDIILLDFLFAARTTEVLISPWQALPVAFFMLYAVTTGVLFYRNHRANDSFFRFALTSLHLFVTFGVAAMIYVHGFGFDGFVHRATQEWIFNNGSILPKQPYYIGQYSMVVLISMVTSVPVFWVDSYFVPAIAALILPPAIAYSLKRGLHMPIRMGTHAVWLIPLLYFITLNLTTPHNVVIMLGIVLIFALFGYLRGKDMSFVIPLIITIAALATHPLLGAPLALFTAAAFAFKHIKNKSKLILGTFLVVMTLLPTLMFTANNLRVGEGLPEPINPITAFPQFLELFERPYWYADTSPLRFELLYTWQLTIVPLVMLFAVYGFIKRRKQYGDWLHPFGMIAFISAAWFLRSWIYFPGVADPEQGNYPLRLIWMSIVFMLPWAAAGIAHVYTYVARKVKTDREAHTAQFISVLTISLMLMVSLYFAYPQRNVKARFPGYNVTGADFGAVEYITHDNEDNNYVVLANPLVGAAALTSNGFAQYHQTSLGEVYYYSIPSGGPLYKYFGQMLYEGQKREYMEAAMDLAGVDKAYFVLNSYWGEFEDIAQGARETADHVELIDNGKVVVFRYER